MEIISCSAPNFFPAKFTPLTGRANAQNQKTKFSKTEETNLKTWFFSTNNLVFHFPCEKQKTKLQGKNETMKTGILAILARKRLN